MALGPFFRIPIARNSSQVAVATDPRCPYVLLGLTQRSGVIFSFVHRCLVLLTQYGIVEQALGRTDFDPYVARRVADHTVTYGFEVSQICVTSPECKHQPVDWGADGGTVFRDLISRE